MPVTVVLAVGLDLPLREIQSSVWQSSGYVVTFVSTIKEAIGRLRDGDFDLALLGQSIPAESQERLTFLIRSTGSQIPVVDFSDSSGEFAIFEGAAMRKPSTHFLEGIGSIMANQTKLPAPIPAMASFEE